MNASLKILALSFFIFFSLYSSAYSAELIQDKQEILKAKVVEIIQNTNREIRGTGIVSKYQEVKIEILEGEQKGATILIENDYIQLKDSQKFYLLKTTRFDDGKITYAVSDIYRLPWIIFFVILFIVLVLIFGGIQGMRGLLSLAGGLLLIFYLLLPQIIAGTSPILIGCIVASLISIIGSYITHGFNRTTTSAVIGMVTTVIMTGLLAYFAVHITSLSGMDSEEAMYLTINSAGSINLQGLLLSGIIIGLLGVLYDSAIGQSISVEELWRADPTLSKKYVFKRALRIGREHIGALVNTLSLAYVGAALPLLVLFSFPSYGSANLLINRELFATEIIRAMIGSIGLVLAVPITTFISVWMLHGVKFTGHKHEHSHSHGHSHLK
jgi:uncharacterized membrane protein